MKQMFLGDAPASELAAPDSKPTLEYLYLSARECWKLLHNWDGPKVAGLVNFENTFAADVDGVNHYVSGGAARVIELDSTHCTVVSVGYTWTDGFDAPKKNRPAPERIPTSCTGKKFKLALYQVAPCHQFIHGGAIWIFENGQAQHVCKINETTPQLSKPLYEI